MGREGDATPTQSVSLALASPAICGFVLGEDKRFGAAWDTLSLEESNNAKMPTEGWWWGSEGGSLREGGRRGGSREGEMRLEERGGEGG